MNSPSITPSTPQIHPEEELLRQERRTLRQQRRKQQRRARLLLWSTISACVILLGLIGFVYWQIQTIASRPYYAPINGVSCDSMEQGGFHIHAHLTVYINGKRVAIPKGIGIAPNGSCFYWLHTHTADGIIHIEAPQQLHNLALDDFLTIWQQGFSQLGFPQELTQTTGWKIFINGKPFKGSVTSPLTTEVPLASHDAVTLEYGSNNPPPDVFYQFPANLPR
jgi:hypothetical protein